MRKFDAKKAVRSSVPLLIGLMGPSGGGKTFSALRLATGIAAASMGSVHVIDTENRRALHYADQFDFQHIDFQPPFGSLDYLGAVRYCDEKGAAVVIVDSLSHEHEGEGGYLQFHEAEIERLSKGDASRRGQVNFLAWAKPSQARQQLIQGLLRLNVNVICCFRAKEKLKLVKNAQGKQEPKEIGWMPIAGDAFLYEMTVNCLLLPRANGVPSWRSEYDGEKLMMKLPTQFESLLTTGKPLDEHMGEALANWAAGGKTKAKTAPPKGEQEQPPEPAPKASKRQPAMGLDYQVPKDMVQTHLALLAAANKGRDAFVAAWKRLTKGEKAALEPIAEIAYKSAVEDAEEEND